jgi:hypothetical protein
MPGAGERSSDRRFAATEFVGEVVVTPTAAIL